MEWCAEEDRERPFLLCPFLVTSMYCKGSRRGVEKASLTKYY